MIIVLKSKESVILNFEATHTVITFPNRNRTFKTCKSITWTITKLEQLAKAI